MSKRLYFMLPDAQLCGRIVAELKDAGIPERHMHAIAGITHTLEGLPRASVLQKSEFIHGLEAGLGFGGAAGFLGGLLAITFPPAGLILGGAAVVATTLAGAGFGALISGLVASDMPNHTIEKFAREIEAGKILLLVDVPRKQTETFIELIKSHHAGADIRVTVRPGHVSTATNH